MVETAIRMSVDTGIPPSVMADRVFDGIREDRFYLLADEGTSWDRAAKTRLDDIRARRNPTLNAVAGEN